MTDLEGAFPRFSTACADLNQDTLLCSNTVTLVYGWLSDMVWRPCVHTQHVCVQPFALNCIFLSFFPLPSNHHITIPTLLVANLIYSRAVQSFSNDQ
jgi:hypothetical protein